MRPDIKLYDPAMMYKIELQTYPLLNQVNKLVIQASRR